MLGEQPDGIVTEIESQDVDFLEEEFPKRGDVDENLELYAIEEPNEGALNSTSEIKSDSIPSGSVPVSGSLPLDIRSQNPQLHKGQHGRVPRCRFEIKGEAFMCASQDKDEPKNYREALSSPASEKWKAAMIEEMESMKKNQVWDLVNLPPG
ncbi:hypothetical protein TorRG33x02_165860, partial [Trema orientale]